MRGFQGSFLGGELDPALHFRADSSLYRAGAKKLTNWIVLPQGGITRRPGMASIGEAGTAKLIPFVFNADNLAMLVFEDETLRIVHDGAFVLDGEAPYTVVSPYLEAELSGIRAAQQGDLVYLDHPNHPPYLLTRLGWANWTLEPVVFGAMVNPPYYVAGSFVGAGAPTVLARYKVQRIGDPLEISLPSTILPGSPGSQVSIPASGAWVDGDVCNIAFYDAEVTAVDNTRAVSDVDYYDYSLAESFLSVRVSATDALEWVSCAEGTECTVFLPGVVGPVTVQYQLQTPALEDPTKAYLAFFASLGVVVPASGVAPPFSLVSRPGATLTIDFTGMGGTPGYFPKGTKFKLVGLQKAGGEHELSTLNEGLWESDGTNNAIPNKVYINTTETLSAYTGGGTISLHCLGYQVYKDLGKGYGFIGEKAGPTDLVGETDVFKDYNIAPDLLQGLQETYTPFATDYPRAVCFHEQRLWHAATPLLPQSLTGSQIGLYNNFNKERPTQDDSLVELTIASQRVDGIRWISSFNGALALGTGGGVHRLTSSDGGAITPSSARAKLMTSLGVLDVEPIAVGASLLVATPEGLVELTFSYEADGYAPANLAKHAAHLFRNRSVVSWAYQRAPYGVLWCVMSDGDVLACTYSPGNAAWCPVEIDGIGADSVAVLPGDVEDEVWFSGTGHVFKLGSFFSETLEDNFGEAAPFTSTLQTLSADTSTTTGKTRLVNTVTAAFLQADGGNAGPDLDHLDPLVWNAENVNHANAGETSLLKIPMTARSSYDGSFYITADGTAPMTILAVMPEFTPGEK